MEEGLVMDIGLLNKQDRSSSGPNHNLSRITEQIKCAILPYLYAKKWLWL